jgi:hypothetical protein
MRYTRLIIGGVLLASSGTLLQAQQGLPVAKEPTRRAGELPPWISNTGSALKKLFSAPLHLEVGSVASGGGLAGGLGLDVPITRGWDFTAKGLYSVKEYWRAESRIEHEGRRTHFEAYGRLRDMGRIAFYGIGNESDQDSRTNFAMREGTAGAFGSFRLLPWVSLGARTEHVWPELSAGKDASLASTTDVFTPDQLPGLGEQPRYLRYEGSVDFMLPPAVGDGFFQGTDVRGTYARFDDRQFDRYTFDRMDLEVRQRFAGLGAAQRLTLHGWVSHTETDEGQDVPFYLLRTLGAKGQIRSVHEYFLGGDQTQATLRGYDSFRFRDRDALLLQAEYRIPLWGPIDATVFYDAGKVAASRSELNLKELHTNYGFSLSFMKGRSTAARVDVGLGGEGTQWLFTIVTGDNR